MAVRVVALAGGVGGAKLVDGLAQVLPAADLLAVVNTGDDFDHLGLHVSPDLDTVVYTLAGVANRERGWGRQGESWQALETLEVLGGPTWFQLGDKDLGVHLFRTQRLRDGERLSTVTRQIRRALGVDVEVLPMSDDRVETIVETDEGTLSFQEYFVRRRFEPRVHGFQFAGAAESEAAPGVLEAIEAADYLLLCPSNPWVSIDPILSVPGIRAALETKTTIAVSPIVGGRALKGPAAKMFRELGFEPSARTVAEHYGSLLSGFVLDRQDHDEKEGIAAMGLQVQPLQTIMKNRKDRALLAEGVLAFAAAIGEGVRA
jgi:LPPG:FO 2-phospho-L-lactate transferase